MRFSNKGRTYAAIHADPPWYFRNYSEKGTGRNACSHYDCMEFEDIACLPVRDMAAKDCALFLWVTDPMLPKAFELIETWGFEYKTVAFYWVKVNKGADFNKLTLDDFFTGLGYWTRANAEQCLLATRGHPGRNAKDVRRLLIDRRREHSRKPDETFRRIEKLVGGPYLELFARETRKGWDAWGNQSELFDDGPVRTRRQPSRLVGQDTAVLINQSKAI